MVGTPGTCTAWGLHRTLNSVPARKRLHGAALEELVVQAFKAQIPQGVHSPCVPPSGADCAAVGATWRGEVSKSSLALFFVVGR